MALTEQRRNEIAWMLTKERTSKEGVKLHGKLRREIGNGAKRLGITTEEAMAFAEELVRGLVSEVFDQQ